jgi:hypothetical protein
VRRDRAPFGPGAAGLYAGGAAGELIGRPVASLAAPTGSGRFEVDGAGLLADVDPDAGVVPALVTGSLIGVPAGGRIAVAVDGRVAASAVTFPDGGGERFSAVVPVEAFPSGPARLELLELTGAGARRLRGSTASYRLAGDGKAIVDGTGRRFPVVAGPPAGRLDALTVEPAAVKASGWAGTTDPAAAAQQVVVFAGKRFLGSVAPSLPRPDLERRYGAGLAQAGFELSGWAAGPRPGSPQAPLRVFALLRGKASELPEPAPPKPLAP